MLIVGFGGGVVVEGVPPSVRHIDVIELEPKVIEANRVTAAAAQAQSAHRSARQRHPQRCARRIAADRPPLRRHRVAALPSVDRRRLAPLHARVHAARARSPELRRRVRSVDERDLHGRGSAAFADRDAAQACSPRCASIGPIRTPWCSWRATRRSISELELARTGLPLRDAPLHYARFGINNVEDLVAALVLDTEGARRTGHRRAADHRRRQSHRHLERVRKGTRHDRRHQRPRCSPHTIRCNAPIRWCTGRSGTRSPSPTGAAQRRLRAARSKPRGPRRTHGADPHGRCARRIPARLSTIA